VKVEPTTLRYAGERPKEKAKQMVKETYGDVGELPAVYYRSIGDVSSRGGRVVRSTTHGTMKP
jgi:hypothetical protein